MSSLGASIPPELFEHILFYVGDEDRLGPCEDPTARREEMKHLSACALTCVYWAQLTRGRMFRRLVLRSTKDINGLRSLLRASSSDRLNPIGRLLSELVICYKLGDLLWFYNVPGLVASGANRLRWVNFHILGPVSPAFTANNTRRSVLHPLFFAVPRVMPMTSFHAFTVFVCIENIHFTHPTMLYNLLQDCKLLHPLDLTCRNLTWDHDHTATPSSFGWTFTHQISPLEYMWLSQCTDNALPAAMGFSAPRHESSRRPHLNSTDSSSLLDIIRASWGQDASAAFELRSFSGFGHIQLWTPARLTPDCDLAFQWWRNDISFYCIASRRPGDDSNTRYATHIIIESAYGSLTEFMEHIKMIDWDAFLRSVQAFPDLHGIIIQSRYNWDDEEEWRKCLVELVLLLREAWAGVDAILQLYHGTGGLENPKWTQILLSSVLEDIDRTKKEAAAQSTSNPEPTLELESGTSDGRDDRDPASSSGSPSPSPE
ncbi:hypothetical protein BDY19DRAFT_997816 [Irpex rosettiformis]|uniref:Uncharacterized protein n=1 Tax=Irpex rosettiformis TaxID=378272 RepID=A0ACB8TQN2_9APHY|nr:hypothetical protein BDY19DRAFT_997816 [Irpex rosettiformis]